jgi:hypothetical protein
VAEAPRVGRGTFQSKVLALDALVGSESSCPAKAVAIVLKSVGLMALPRPLRPLYFLWQRHPGNADNAGR